MTMRWDLAAGSIVGRDHARAGRNNQDAVALWSGDAAACAVVCDGCGGAPHSEWGARLGARLVAAALARRSDAPWARLWPEVQGEVLAGLRAAAALVGDPHDHLLFTIVAALARGGEASAAAIGDGAVVWDGAPLLGRDPGDAPAYLGHGLDGDAPAFRVLGAGPCRTLALASDGAADLSVGPLFADDLVWRNPDGLRRRLAVLARGGGLGDDTTVALLRRSP
jgi:hypothetical protein